MKSAPPALDIWSHPLARNYAFLCMGGLMLILLTLVMRGIGSWSLAPVLIGLLGLVLRWNPAPLFVLLFIVIVQPEIWELLSGYDPSWPYARLSDVILCTGVVVYVAAHYRIVGLSRFLIPPDLRYRRAVLPPRQARMVRGLLAYRQTRSADWVSLMEIAVLLLTAPLWAILAGLVWLAAPADLIDLDMPYRVRHMFILFWVLGVVGLVTAGVIGYLGRRRMTRAEALLMLQDMVWQETREPMRFFSRWLAWSRLQWYERKDLP